MDEWAMVQAGRVCTAKVVPMRNLVGQFARRGAGVSRQESAGLWQFQLTLAQFAVTLEEAAKAL